MRWRFQNKGIVVLLVIAILFAMSFITPLSDSLITGWAIITSSPDSYENDDTWQNATNILINGSRQQHGFSPQGDVDYIKFNATASHVYIIETNNLSTIDQTDTVLTLYSTDGTTQLRNNDDIYPGVVRTSRLVWTAQTNGTYYVKVNEWENNGVGNYEIWVIQMGLLQPYLVSPSSATNVSKYSTFNVTMGIRCVDGRCLNIKATLDPEEVDKDQTRNAKVEPEVLEIMEEDRQVEVVVMLTGNESGKLQKENIELKQDKVISKLRTAEINSSKWAEFKVKRRYESVNGFAGTVNERGLKKLMMDPNVKKIHLDRKFNITLDISVPNLTAPQLWPIQISGQNITGKDQTVCVIDTGINYLHADFGSCSNYSEFRAHNCRVLDGYDFVNNDLDPNDDNSHGSHCAGIIASQDSTYKGMAPEANLIAIKVLGSSGSGSSSDVIAGIDWCVSNASVYNITAISMSLGERFSKYNFHCNDASEASAINAAVAQGITVVVAAGNDGYTDGIGTPGCIQNSTSVGAVSDSNTFYYNRGITLDLLAPGIGIMATQYDGTHVSKSGTSMATPHVAGAVALLQQYSLLNFNRTLQPWQVTQKLKYNGANLYDSGSKHTFTKTKVYSATLAKGAIPTTEGATPFYTLSSNPHDTSCLEDMDSGQTCNQTWIVNATGLTDTTWEFFGIYETLYQSNTTHKFNITIKTGISLSPSSGWNTSNNNLSFTCTAYDNNLSNITLWHNLDGTWQANHTTNITGTENSTSWSFSSVSDGQYLWACSTKNVLNDLAKSINYSIGVDTVKPNLTLNEPINNYNSSLPNIIFNWTAEKSIELYCNLSVGNIVISSNISILNNSAHAENHTLVDGIQNWSVSCWDYIGNQNTSDLRNLTIDATPPSLSIISPQKTYYNTLNLSLNYSVLDSVSSINNCWYNLNGSNITLINCTNTSLDVSTGIQEGSNLLKVYVNDTFGNLNTTIINFTIDLSVPIINLSAPLNSTSWTSSSTVAFDYFVYDAAIANCSLIVNSVASNSDLTITVNASQTIAYVLNNGNYNWSIACTDYANNQNTSATGTWAVSYIAPVPSTVRARGGGGGGGGGGAGPSKLTKTSETFSTISAGSSVVMSIDEELIPVKEVILNSKKDAENVKVSVETVSLPPSIPLPSFPIYKSLKIESGLPNEVIDSATITFTVEKDWIENKSYDKNKVKLNRYTTEWEALTTSMVKDNKINITYRATTPGFSYFAITAEMKEVKVKAPRVIPKKEAVVRAPTKENITKPLEESTRISNINLIILIVSVTIILIIVEVIIRKVYLKKTK